MNPLAKPKLLPERLDNKKSSYFECELNSRVLGVRTKHIIDVPKPVDKVGKEGCPEVKNFSSNLFRKSTATEERRGKVRKQ